MKWEVEFHEDFDPEFDAIPEDVQDEIRALAGALEKTGPLLGRPRADTLNGSRHATMKELRFDASDGVWRVAFAFACLSGLMTISIYGARLCRRPAAAHAI
jgi:hypothetical protein